MKIIWSPQARQDLHRIGLYIARDKKEAATRWVEIVEKKVRRLTLFPRSGRIVPELKREEIREVIVGAYRIIYKVERTISVLTVFHGASLLSRQKISSQSVH